MKNWDLLILVQLMDIILKHLEENLQYAKKMKGPVLLHVITKKGKGYKPAEQDKIGTWHGTGPYKMETGDFVKSVNKSSILEWT